MNSALAFRASGIVERHRLPVPALLRVVPELPADVAVAAVSSVVPPSVLRWMFRKTYSP